MTRGPMLVCAVDGCDRSIRRADLCNMHGLRMAHHGTTDRAVRQPSAKVKPKCSIPGCDRDSRARGWCDMHWQRWKKKGDLGGGVSLRRNRVAYFWDFVDKN